MKINYLNLKYLTVLLINILFILAINILQFKRDLYIHDIIYVDVDLYQADVIDNISRVFFKNVKVDYTKNISNRFLDDYNFSYLSNNKIQFSSMNPRFLYNKIIGNGIYKFNNKIYFLFFALELILIGIYFLRFKIKFFSLQIVNDFHNDFKNTLVTLVFYKYFILMYLFYLSFIICTSNFTSIIVWDEAVYLNTGRDLVDKFELWPYARGPLIQFFYGIVYFILTIFSLDSDWLLSLSIIGKLLYLNITFLIILITASRLTFLLPKTVYKPEIFVASSLVFFPFANLVNPSYSLYTLVFSFTFYFLLLYIQTKEKFYIFMVSISLGFLGLVRPDVLIILPLLFLILFYLDHKLKVFTLFLYSALPGLIIIYGYQFFIFLATGLYDSGSMTKLYLAFEAAESLNLKNNYSSFIDWYNASKLLAENTYGSAVSNHNNIFIAISKNPIAFLNRELLTLKMLPGALAEGYTFFNISSAYFLLFIFISSLFLLYRSSKQLFFIFIAIFSHLSLYFITLIYSSYLLLDFLIFSLLISIFISYICGYGYKNKLLIFMSILICFYLNLISLMILFISILLLFNFQTKNSVGLKFKIRSISRFIGINFFLFAIIVTFQISNFKLPASKNIGQSEVSDIYKAKNIASIMCNDGNLISQTYAFPIFSKLSFLPIDSDLINNFDNIDYLVNKRIVSCIFVDKIMMEQNPMNILNGIEKLKNSNHLTVLFTSNEITLYRIK